MLGGGHGGAVKGVILACRRIQGIICCSSVVLIHTGHPKAPKALKAVATAVPKGSTSCQGQAALVQNLKSRVAKLSQFSCLTASIRLAAPVTESEPTPLTCCPGLIIIPL